MIRGSSPAEWPLLKSRYVYDVLAHKIVFGSLCSVEVGEFIQNRPDYFRVCSARGVQRYFPEMPASQSY
jgi:hypothetical protein